MNDNFLGVVIDPGHGGVDGGAKGSNILEKDYNLLISKYMYDRFNELGVPVYITREDDITLNPTDRVNKVLSSFGNNPNVIVVSNHLNAGKGTGAEIIYALRNDSRLADMILTNIGDTGQKIRKVYQRRLPSDVTKDYYYILRNTGQVEPVIVEYGFIDNDSDLKFLEDNYKELAEEVIKAILEYKGIPYMSPEKDNNGTYKVVKGDTLYGIALKYNTTVDKLKELNNLDSNVISIGEELIVPFKNMSVYTVKAGDTLYGISKKIGVPVDKIKEANKLTSDILSIGQDLIIPNEEDMTYKVMAGDTLYSIAKKFGLTVDELKKLNNLVDDILSIGKILIVK